MTQDNLPNWGPIDTAPKDGCLVDVWISTADGQGRREIDVWWCSVERLWLKEGDVNPRPAEADESETITHWYPAPPGAPPTA